MLKMKKIIALALLVIMICLNFANVVIAGEGETDNEEFVRLSTNLNLGTNSMDVGEKVQLTLLWLHHDVQAFDLKVKYDKDLVENMAVYVMYNDIYEKKKIEDEYIYNDANNGILSVSWFSNDNRSIDRIFFDFVAKKPGNCTLELDIERLIEGNLTDLKYQFTNNSNIRTFEIRENDNCYSVEQYLLSKGSLYDLNTDGVLLQDELDKIKNIYINNDNIISLDTSIAKNMSNLESFRVSSKKLKVMNVDSLSGLENLNYLQISADNLVSLDMESIYKIKNLTNFSIGCNDKEIINNINFEKLSGLTRLVLKCDRMDEFDFNKLKPLQNLKEIDYGFLYGDNLEDICFNDYGPLGALKNLETHCGAMNLENVKALYCLENERFKFNIKSI